MTDPELRELADLWQQPDQSEAAGESDRLQAMARRARRRGRYLAYADWALAFLLVGGTVFALSSSPGPHTTFAAAALLIATIWLTWQRRRLRQMSATLDTADRQSFIASSARGARGNLRRAALTIASLPPLVILSLLVKISFREGGYVSDFGQALLAWARSPRGMISLVIFALIIAWSVRSIRRSREELKRLDSLRRAYEEEDRAAGEGPG
jgi:hypothetical protein